MPKSKRNRVVTLTQTQKKGYERKTGLIEEIRECTGKYEHVWVVAHEHMRNGAMKEVRRTWQGSRFFFGKNKVMQVALGREPEEEVVPGISLLAKKIEGLCGVFFTNESSADVEKFFKEYKEEEYAKAGTVVNQTVSLPAGPLDMFVHSQEPYLRDKLGLPVQLKNGQIILREDFVVCKEGQTLTPEQGRILQLLDMKLAQFTLKPVCRFQISNGKLVEFDHDK